MTYRYKNLTKIHQNGYVKDDPRNFACKHPTQRQRDLSKNNTNFLATLARKLLV